ncbi:hypothetical protein LNV57_23195, partial [Klebsiella pneumoniae]|nr:hypothetical protein [Klebsiella pneumoniae]MCJ4695420.1 hypothetical protein [Klebsiella pneumoniae]
AQIREILISESAWEEMTCLFAPSLAERPPLAGNDKGVKNITMPTNSFLPFYRLLLMCFYL